MEHEEFVRRLQMLFLYLKRNMKPQLLELVQILLKDNIKLKSQLEAQNEQRSSKESK